jgi:hypothetical protein
MKSVHLLYIKYRPLAILTNIRLAGKNLPGKNTLAYVAKVFVTNKKVLKTLKPGVNFIKLFSA